MKVKLRRKRGSKTDTRQVLKILKNVVNKKKDKDVQT